jgi:hypothetical protein
MSHRAMVEVFYSASIRVGNYDSKECPLLGYKIPDCTSQKTRYFSVREPSHLMLCKICGIHGGDF